MIELNIGATVGMYIFVIGMLVFLMTIAINYTILMLAGQDGSGSGNYLFYLVIQNDKFFKTIARSFLSGVFLMVTGALIFGANILITLLI